VRLPHAEEAITDEYKITAYLLSSIHAAGAPKAAFFGRFGFSSDAWTVLRDAFLGHAREHEVTRISDTPFGQAFEVTGRLMSPDGRNPWVKVVWFVRSGETAPRLVTAVPSKDPNR
jgi:hypothetical protein